MKRSEVLIQKIAKTFNISEATAADIYKIVNDFDWKVFCSYMADYDHPEERTEARHELLAKRNNYSESFRETFDEIETFIHNWEDYNIHKMNEEVE